MADKNIPINFYVVRIYGTGDRETVATIELRNDDMVGKTVPFAWILFYPEGAAVPPDSTMAVGWGGEIVNMRLPERRLAPVLAFLREEEPVALRWSEERREAWLETVAEPTGEEEGTGG